MRHSRSPKFAPHSGAAPAQPEGRPEGADGGDQRSQRSIAQAAEAASTLTTQEWWVCDTRPHTFCTNTKVQRPAQPEGCQRMRRDP